MTDALSALKSLRAWIAEWTFDAGYGLPIDDEDLREALREADEAIAACGWREMDDAPKDGTPILLWLPKALHSNDIDGYAPFMETHVVLGWWDGDDHDWEMCFMATHWQPRPAPPAALRQIEGDAE